MSVEFEDLLESANECEPARTRLSVAQRILLDERGTAGPSAAVGNDVPLTLTLETVVKRR